MSTNLMGHFSFLDNEVWYDQSAVGNILSLGLIMDSFPVTMDSYPNVSESQRITVHLPDNSVLDFFRGDKNLFYHDPDTMDGRPIFNKTSDHLVNVTSTVEENLKVFTRQQRKGIRKAHDLYQKLGYPSHATLLKMISQNQMAGCPITREDANNMAKAYGPSIAALRGKTVRRPPERIAADQLIPLPREIQHVHPEVTLCIDIFYVDTLKFLAGVSRNYRKLDVQFIPSRSVMNSILPALKKIMTPYALRGIPVKYLHGDQEFEPLRDVIAQPEHGSVHTQIAGADDKIGPIERAIRTIKERTRCSWQDLPYERFPNALKKALVCDTGRTYSMFPHPDGVSEVFSPHTLVTGIPFDYDRHARVRVGGYYEVHLHPDPTNTMEPRTIWGVALGPQDLITRSWNFLSLETGSIRHSTSWTELPITQAVIDRVHEIADDEKGNNGLNDFVFEWAPGQLILDIDDDDEDNNQPAVPVEPEAGGANDNNDNDEIGPEEGANDEPDDDETGPEEGASDEEEGASGDHDDVVADTVDYDDDSLGDQNYVEEQASEESTSEPKDEEAPNSTPGEEEDKEESDIEEPYVPLPSLVERLETPDEIQEDEDLLDDEPLGPPPMEDEERPLTARDMRARRRDLRREVLESVEEITPDNIEADATTDTEHVVVSESNENDTENDMGFEPGTSDHEDDGPIAVETCGDDEDEPEDTPTTFETSTQRTDSPTEDLLLVQADGSDCRVRTKSWCSKETFLLFSATVEPKSVSIHDMTMEALHKKINEILLVTHQMSAKQGVKHFGDRAIEALIQEFSQLDDKGTFDPMSFKDLTYQQRKDALRAIALIKEKRDLRIKGRTVADGRPQRKHTSPEEVWSPTVSQEGMFLSLAIDAKERRHVAICDVEGAYLHADMDEFVVMVFEGDLVDYMVKVDPEKYGPRVHITKDGKKLLYVRLVKALYGCMRSAMLWWQLLTSTLLEEGFEVNPYDPCIANKTMSGGGQATVCWYVDDLKISHVDEHVVRQIISSIEARYGEMKQSHGPRHTYLGMKIEFTDDGEVLILMDDHLQEAIDLFPEDCKATAATPAATHLFNVNPTAIKLPEPNRKIFHSIVAKLLWVSKRARPDILVALSFLTSRVTKADDDDWKKLRRVLCYLHHTKHIAMTLSVDDLCVVKTWVDAAFAVHDDMKSHTGGYISMGKGTLYASSKRQKLNTKSSTEAELVGAGDFLTQTIWTTNFLRAQGYDVNHYFNQDNMSAMKMEKNGRQSAGQKSRHISIRYFFIKDRIEKKDINLIYCPTDLMIADFFSKPLQGGIFRKFRDIVLGIKHPDDIQPKLLESQERVASANNEGILRNSSVESTKSNISWADIVAGPPGANARAGNTRNGIYSNPDTSSPKPRK